MGPRPHVWFLEFKTAPFGSELVVSMGPIPHLLFCACETAWLASELLVSMGPSPLLWFLRAKSDFWIRTTSLYGSQTSPVDLRMQNIVLRSRMKLVYWSQRSSGVLCIQNSTFSIRITSLYGSQPSFVAFACKTATLGPQLQVSMRHRPHLWFYTFITANLAPKSFWVPDLTCCFVHAKQRD